VKSAPVLAEGDGWVNWSGLATLTDAAEAAIVSIALRLLAKIALS
jgi:hypothetical protein